VSAHTQDAKSLDFMSSSADIGPARMIARTAVRVVRGSRMSLAVRPAQLKL
jgi:hypothetical protein